MLTISVQDLRDLYKDLTNNDFYSAFKRAVKILNLLVNPDAPTGLLTAGGLDCTLELHEVMCDLDSFCCDVKSDPMTMVAVEGVDTSISPDDVINIVLIIIDLFRKFRRKPAPTP